MTEKKLTIRAVIKNVALTILVLIGFFGLWSITFIYCLALTFMNFGLSLMLSLFISATTIFALVVICDITLRRRKTWSDRKVAVGAYVLWIIIFVLSLVFTVNIVFSSILSGSIASMVVVFIKIYSTLRKRRRVVQK